MAAIEKYLRRGWALVPLHYITSAGLCSCGNPECRSVGKHPIGNAWQHNVYRMTDPLPWDGHPQLNIGIATGAPSGFWVLDWDPKAGTSYADELLVKLIDDGFDPHVRTGGMGTHWRFEMPADFEVTNRRGTLPAGLDVRGTGGQVVAPPSVSGKGPYVELPTPGDGMPYVTPGWLLDMIRPASPLPREAPAGWSPSTFALPDITGGGSAEQDRGQRYAKAAVDDMLAELAATPSGRNTAAFTAACRILEFANAGWIEAPAVIGAWNLVTHAHPLGVVVPQSEVESIWRSAQRTVGDRPAELPPEWTDPLRIEVWPTPPVDAAGVPPFSASSSNGASGYRVPQFSEPGTTSPSPNGTGPSSLPASPDSFGTSPSPDPQAAWDAAVEREAHKVLLREAAKRRAREIESMVGPDAVDAMEAELLDVAGMQSLPSLVALVDGVLFMNSLARLNGPSGDGKSFIALDIAARVTRGLSWAGRTVRQGRVIYGVAEGASGFKDRLTAWELTHGPIGELWCLPRPVQALAAEWSVFVEVCRRRRPDLVVIDTQARATEGVDELDRAEMSRLVVAAEALRAATGACVLLVHHTPQRGDDGRGHTEVKGALQSEMLARKKGSKITLTSRKQKDRPDFDPIEFDLVGVPAPPVESMPGFTEPGGRRIISAVPVWLGEQVTTDAPREPVARVRARALWAVLADPAVQREGLSEVDMRPRMADLCGLAGASMDSIKKAQQRAMAELAALGLIAKRVGMRRFAVVILSDQGSDGVLTSNLNVDGVPVVHPDGDWELYMPNVASEVK